MAISTEEKYLLNNKMGKVANKVQLGTLIQAAESVAASEIALADGDVLVGNASNIAAAVALSGDVTMPNTGVVTIGAKKVTAAKTALADGKFLIGGAGGAAAEQTLSGDVTSTNAGVTAIGAGKVLLAMLGAGIAPSHRVYAAGKFTTAGGDATETITVAGAVATDIIQVTVQTKGGTPRSILEAIPGTGNVVVTLSGDPSTDHILAWVAYRAAS